MSSHQKIQRLMGVECNNLGPNSQPEKHYDGDDDRLSELPDEVLIVILSCLPLRDAARSTLLSSRWSNLWTYSSCLNFDADDTLHKFEVEWHTHQNYKQRDEDRCKYINWVNSIIRSHKAPTLDEFSICIDFDRSSHKEIPIWLDYAFARRVQRLELSRIGYAGPYDFPAEFLGRGTNCKAPTLFRSLKALCLRRVNVTGEDIDFFLRNCPFLEQLIVQASRKISKVEICGSSLALKHLEIFDSYISRPPIKISAPNLTSLKVETLWELLLENVPKLVVLTLMRGCDLYEGNIVHLLHCCLLSQLEILTVNVSLKCIKQPELSELPQMPKLRKVRARYMASSCEAHIIDLTNFIRASPQLQELEVKMVRAIICKHGGGGDDGIMHFPHQHLKVLKISGCYGNSSEIKFVRNMWVNCVALQKIIIDPHFQQSNPPTQEDIVMEQTARLYLKQHLEPHVPNHIKLLIL